MKKILLPLLFVVLGGAYLSGWEPEDLTKYPSCTDPKDFTLSIGAGIEYPEHWFTNGYYFIPPVQLKLDKNVPMGEKQLPFFFGGQISYAGEGRKYNNDNWYHSKIGIAARVGYHFNWDIKNFDTYLVTVAGWRLYFGEHLPYDSGWPVFGIKVGARYYVSDFFGFWAEAGYVTESLGDIGIVFKF